MTKGQIFIAVCAGAFLLLLANFMATALIGGVVGGCTSMPGHYFTSPDGRFTVEQTLAQCDDNPESVELTLYDPTDSKKRTVLLQSPARFTDADGRTYDPVSFGIRWPKNDQLEITYPFGLKAYSGGHQNPRLEDIQADQWENYGLHIKALPGAL